MTVLLYRALGLGDFCAAVPAYRAVLRAHPDDDVVLAAPEPLRPLVPLVDRRLALLPTRALDVPAVHGADVAVNLHGRGPQSHRALLATGAGRLVAFASRDAGVDGPPWRADEHEVARWCRLVSESGLPADRDDLPLARPAAAAPVVGAAVVHPGAASQARRWPEERFARVAAELARGGHHVVITGVSSERALCERIARRAGLVRAHVLAGCLDLGRMAALVAAARLVVCGDTGVAHLASAYRTPSVVLFGPVAPALWGPPARPWHRALWRPGRSAAGIAGADPSLSSITVEDVLVAAREAEVSAPRPRS